MTPAVLFLSTLPARGATSIPAGSSSAAPFLSTLPARGATSDIEYLPVVSEFLSTLPARGATRLLLLDLGQGVISIHAPREGSDVWVRRTGGCRPISIHAPREGSDYLRDGARKSQKDFYPRSPRGERRGRVVPVGRGKNFYPRSPRGERPSSSTAAASRTWTFLSTLPARGATRSRRTQAGRRFLFLSTLPARGATLVGVDLLGEGGTISIHAPREGSDRKGPRAGTHQADFYPRSPRGERRLMGKARPQLVDISIHAPREGSDASSKWPRGRTVNFYPRSPRGERRRQGRSWQDGGVSFLSTLPARGATASAALSADALAISIHAPREGSDAVTEDGTRYGIISIHAPREGSDWAWPHRPAPSWADFYPRSPRGERQQMC